MGVIDEQAANRLNARRGLSRRFFLTVVLPPVIPFIVLGYLGYGQLSGLIRASLIDQLAKSAQTTAAKVDREISIRQTVLTKTAEEVFEIKNEFDSRRSKLATQRDSCTRNVSVNISFIGQADCDPFLAEFARLTVRSSSPSSVLADYRQAISQGYQKQVAGLTSDEKAKISDRLRSYTVFFPETTEIVIKAGGNTVAETASISQRYKSSGSGVLPLQTAGDKRLVGLGGNVSAKGYSGSVLAAYDADHSGFLKPSWQSAPRPYKEDAVYIAESSGSVVYPKLADSKNRSKILASAAKQSKAASPEYSFNEGGKPMIARSARINDSPWLVMAASPTQLVLGELNTAQNLALGAIVISLLVSLFVGLVFVASATEAIKKLLAGALLFASGKLDHKITLKTKDELQALAETMNDMAAQILAGQKALDEKNKEFISVATHELKAPMTSIIGNLSMVLEDGMGKVDRQARELIGQAFLGTTRLRELVTDMLDIARLEGGKIQFEIKPTDIGKLTNEIISMQSVPAKGRKVSFAYQPGKPPQKVLADEAKLQIILTNFISNAIKYNRTGGQVIIRHSVQNGHLTTSVADTGLGIPKEQQAKMFQKFFRVQSRNRSNIPGTGLGLYITKQFIEAMGGAVWFESQEGKGTAFYFRLPLAE
ncbi:MAG TPA: HAMP domain-containing sensor histidine kinase [Candidatus Dormibacteraeota bacterium]|nr:HAMP domain-containing sensor histidine kinase [Candidatus Dormibacteraeota bacterium]